MSGLMSAISGGLSAAGYGAGDLYAKEALMDKQSEADTQRATRLAEFQEQVAARSDLRKANLATDMANKERESQVSNIDAKMGQMADEQPAAKRALIDSGIKDRSTWTADQQAVVDQSQAIDEKNYPADRKTYLADPKVHTAASIALGYITPKEAATFNQKDDAQLYKHLYESAKEDGRNTRAEEKDASRESIAAANAASRESIAAANAESSERKSAARLAVILSKVGGRGDNPTKEALQFLDGSRKEVASDAQNLKALYAADTKDLSTSKRAAVEAAYKPKFAEIERKRSQIEEDYGNMREKVGLPPLKVTAPDRLPAQPDQQPPSKSAAPASRASQFKVLR